jgi:hypothetical protein
VLPDIGHLEQIGIQPGLRARLPESGLVHQGRARRHYHPVQVVLVDVVLDQRLPRVGAHVDVVPGDRHILQAGGKVSNCGYIHRGSDIGTTVANVYSNPGMFSVGIPVGWLHPAASFPHEHVTLKQQFDPGRSGSGLFSRHSTFN